MNALQKPYLRLMGLAPAKIIKRLLPGYVLRNENALWFFVDFATSTYKSGTVFDIIINGETFSWNHDYKMELTGITDQLGGSLEQIEKGYKTICEFTFTPKIPPQIKLLPNLNDWDLKEHTILIGRHQDIEILGPVHNIETTLNNYEQLVLEKMAGSHKKYFTIIEIAKMIPRTNSRQHRQHIAWLAMRLINRGRLKEEGEERFVLVDK